MPPLKQWPAFSIRQADADALDAVDCNSATSRFADIRLDDAYPCRPSSSILSANYFTNYFELLAPLNGRLDDDGGRGVIITNARVDTTIALYSQGRCHRMVFATLNGVENHSYVCVNVVRGRLFT